ncbi:ATP/GTP-binding protein [Streptomyces sp. NPDC089919]|uniref:ATP/GTP-binding protein n=1 Tax=Streptomyces sp. NPDC089919 TaxID=3155188 RepID=UPI003418E0A6
MPVPKPGGPPTAGAFPVPPAHAPATGPSLLDWLRTPRPEAPAGVWRLGYAPRPEQAAEQTPGKKLLSSALISFLACVLVWTLLRNGLIPYWTLPPRLFTPGDWWTPLTHDPVGPAGQTALWVWELLIDGALLYGFGQLGGWRTAWDRLATTQGPWVRIVGVALVTWLAIKLVTSGAIPVQALVYQHLVPFDTSTTPQAMQRNADRVDMANVIINVVIGLGVAWAGGLLGLLRSRFGKPAPQPAAAGVAAPAVDPAAWPDLRAAGLTEAADRLGTEAASGRMTDVDYARIRRAWTNSRSAPARQRAFTEAIRAKGAAACVHPSGVRDLAVRAARHDLYTGQVRLGAVADGERNPYPMRGTGLALDPTLLGTSLLAVGPSGSGKTGRLVRPVVESLALHALAGQAVVIAVAAAGTRLGPDESYDVVIRLGDPASPYDLDLYGGTTDPDEAAAMLAEAFTGDVPGADVRRAATVLAQLLGPFRAVHGRFPAVPELRELLDGIPQAFEELRAKLTTTGQSGMLRELDARQRQQGAAGDPGPLLADRVALLDRPAFADFFDTSGNSHPFTLRALEHPLRVRIDLPERSHTDASRMLARLILAQYTAAVAARTDRSLFACLVMDDAAHTPTPQAIRDIARLRSHNAGVVLALRTLDDVPEHLRAPLLGAVGCKAAFAGITTWDGAHFASAWGTEWVETRDVTQRTVFADQPLTRAIHSFRKLVTGKAVTTDAVTVRQVERERWSASDLAHAVPAGCAVVSLTSVRGERAAPLLVQLNG